MNQFNILAYMDNFGLNRDIITTCDIDFCYEVWISQMISPFNVYDLIAYQHVTGVYMYDTV